MKVVKLHHEAPIAVQREEILKYLKENPNTYFFLDQKQVLHEYIDQLDLDNRDEFYLKVLNDFDFDFAVFLKDNRDGSLINQNLPSLSHLFQTIFDILEKSDIRYKDLKIVLDTISKDVLSTVIQQFIYADLIIDITLKIEEEKREIVNGFRKNAEIILKDAETLLEEIKDLQPPLVGDLSKEIQSHILKKLDEVPSIIAKAQDRPIKIALLGPRRNGKSEIANCILGENYVPTTQNIITVTNCIYEKSTDGKLRVIQETTQRKPSESIIFQTESLVEKEKTFDTVNDTRKYLEGLFKEGQLDSTKRNIPEVKVQYLPTENTMIPNIILIDTPGPNIADAKKKTSETKEDSPEEEANREAHKKLAYRWLKEADVILFVIELQYARNKENVAFIQDVQKEIFESKGKNYSLIFVGNKSDLRFEASEKPSLIRMLDRFKAELYGLKLDAFVSVATSALTFNGLNTIISDYVVDNEGSKKMDLDSAEYLEDIRKYHKKKYRGSNNNQMLTAGMVINKQSEGIDLYFEKEATINLLKEASGIDTLIRYTRYIAEEKALFEVINLAIRQVQEIFIDIETNLLSKSILQFKGNKQKVIEILNEYKRTVNRIRREKLSNVRLENLDEVVEDELRFNSDNISSILMGRFIHYMNTTDFGDISNKEDLVDKIIRGYSLSAASSAEIALDKVAENINIKLIKAVDKKEVIFTDVYKEIENEFKIIKERLAKEELKIDKFSFPGKPTFTTPNLSLSTGLQDSLEEYVRHKLVDKTEGIFVRIFRWVANLFNAQDYIDQIINMLPKEIIRSGDNWTVYKDDMEKTELGRIFAKQGEKMNEDFKKACKSELKNWQEKTKLQISESIDFIENQVDILTRFLETEHTNVVEQIAFLESISDKFEEFQSKPEIDFVFNINKNLIYAS
ncbi:MAG: dynamin family protein [Saprospiraceae bacterium]|nr:dynamin family protein [Saprospiraceae bacterium]